MNRSPKEKKPAKPPKLNGPVTIEVEDDRLFAVFEDGTRLPLYVDGYGVFV